MLFRFEKTTTETQETLYTLCGYGFYSRKRVLEWFRRLRDGCEHRKIS